MARTKQRTPLQREPSDFDRGPPESPGHGWKQATSDVQQEPPPANGSLAQSLEIPAPDSAGFTQLIICVGGIYASLYTPILQKSNPTQLTPNSLSWGFLQERITTTTYGPPHSPDRFTYSVVLNTIQSAFAALTGYIYLLSSTPRSQPTPSPIPSLSLLPPLLLVAITSSLASPFGYASLSHIDYITFLLAKSCKLLPVMFLQLTIFRKPYPLYKYGVVALVTAGVALFTLYHPSSSSKKSSPSRPSTTNNSTWGLFLLAINLLFDGLTNTTQDHIFRSQKNRSSYSGPQMMVAQNLLSTLLTTTYLLLSPHLPFPPSPSPSSPSSELASALAFTHRHPTIISDLLAFSACGAVGQIFIYYTLSHFSSLLLVTVTVTRKMLTMMLSVVWFGHRLSGMQWVGVGLVFGGVGAEGWIQRREKRAKEREREREKKGA
ncbi:UDP-galactose transporter [Loxospora ochrophaea]|nr:UDP-galactose transporter [Loxospora ochrophaea]